MFKRAYIRRGLKALAVLMVFAAAACTGDSDPTGLDEDAVNGSDAIEAGWVLGQ